VATPQQRIKTWADKATKRTKVLNVRVRWAQHLKRLERKQRRKVIQRRRAAVQRRGHVDAAKQSQLLADAQAALARTRQRLDRAEIDVVYSRRELAQAKAAMDKIAASATGILRFRAWKIAEGLVGVMEHGGNNTGPMVDRIIRDNNGAIGEPWCGDTAAYCYRKAGSKAPERLWASAHGIEGDPDIAITRRPQRGNLANYTFEHIGLFGARLHGGYIETIEGNTGPTGAVSDSTTGGDGVYRKHRDAGLVRHYMRVTR
jgi:hypothetical protein